MEIKPNITTNTDITQDVQAMERTNLFIMTNMGIILAELPIMATSPRSMTSTDITQAELSETGTQSTIMTNMGTARDAPKSTMTVL